MDLISESIIISCSFVVVTADDMEMADDQKIFLERIEMSLVSIQPKDIIKYGRILLLERSAGASSGVLFLTCGSYRAARDKGEGRRIEDRGRVKVEWVGQLT